MKKIILLSLIFVSAWGYYTKSTKMEHTPLINPSVSTENNEPGTSADRRIQLQCDGRQHCSQMSSYEEAKYFIENCPDTKMDGDGDGIPCERQFSRW